MVTNAAQTDASILQAQTNMTSMQAAGRAAAQVPAVVRGGEQAGGSLVVASAAATQMRDRLVRKARRHTVFVKLMRVLLPLIVIASFAGYGLFLKTSLSIGGGTLVPGKIEVTSDDLKMKNPRYFGVTKENGKYEVRAREAIVDLAMTGPVKLEGIDGDLTQANGVRTLLKATRGILDRQKSELELYDGVDVDATNGMRAQLERAMILTKEHRVISKDPVRAQMPTGTLTANSMDFSTATRVGKFRGNVALKLVQTPSATTGARPSIGLGGDAKQPVEIRAQEFDIDDLKSNADFRGQVLATQGETQLRAPEMNITYEGQASRQAGFDGAPTPAPAAGAPTPAEGAGGAQLSRLIARTGVVLTAGTDRRIAADVVDFDVKADTALFTGNVELTQARNAFRGGRLTVDRKAGKSRLDAPAATPSTAPPGRIAATLIQGAEAPKPGAPSKAKALPVNDPQSALGGLRGDPNAPTDIDAETLDVNETAKQAIFRGKVVAKQGEYTIQTAELVANYTGQTGLLSTGPDTAKGPAGGTQLTTIETRGGTRITSKDGKDVEGQTASFDVKANKVVIAGPQGVSLKQANNVGQCMRVKMDLTTGEAQCENTGAAATAPAPTPAQLSIAAKPGVAPPTQPAACPPGGGQQCIIVYPEALKQAAEGKASATPPVVVQRNPKPVAPPQTSPSSVYRGN
jgi:lipopolysaccharide export system protein LptA